jgi:hypothetical protein
MEWPIGMEPFNSVRHNRAGRINFMQGEALSMESLKDCEECVDVCLHHIGSRNW